MHTAGTCPRVATGLRHLFQYMLDVQTRRNELGSFLAHGSQQSFPAFVDERDVIQVDNAGSLVLNPVRTLPGGSQLADPRPNQTTLQDPSPIRFRLRDGYFQHVYFSRLPRACACVSTTSAPH